MKKVKVVKDKCIGCGLCPAMAENVFDLDNKGLAYNKIGNDNPIDLEDLDDVIQAVESCPTEAIILEDI